MQVLSAPVKQSDARTRKPVVVLLACLSAYYVWNIFLVGISGNFPLNDDWMYGLEVQRMMQTGQLHLFGGSPACVMHVAVGAAICKIFGFSFVTLRCVTLAFSFLGCVLLYSVLRQLKVHSREATFAALVLACNPIYVNLSFLYMTDVPALTYSLAYVALVLWALNQNKWQTALAAAAPLLAAIAVRQNNVLFAACNGLVAAFIAKVNRPLSLAIFIGLVLCPFACGYYLDHLMARVNEFPAAYDWYKHEIARILHLATIAPYHFCFIETVSAVRAAAYIGLFALPLLAALAAPSILLRTGRRSMDNSAESSDDRRNEQSGSSPKITREQRSTSTREHVDDAQSIHAHGFSKLAAAGHVIRFDVATYYFIALISSLAATTFLVWFSNDLMPFSPNLLMVPELGSETMIGYHSDAPITVNILLTAAAAVSSFVMLTALACCLHRTVVLAKRAFSDRSPKAAHASGHDTQSAYRDSKFTRAAAYGLIVSLSLMTFAWSVFHSTIANLDRYFLPPFVFAIPCILLAARWLRRRLYTAVSVGALLIIASYSSFAEHDYIECNRIRWQAISDLMAQGIPAKNIDGGLEFNYFNDPRLSNDLQLKAETFVNIHKGSAETAKLRWWSVPGEDFIVSMQPIAGYQTIKSYAYFSVLTFQSRAILVLQKI